MIHRVTISVHLYYILRVNYLKYIFLCQRIENVYLQPEVLQEISDIQNSLYPKHPGL